MALRSFLRLKQYKFQCLSFFHQVFITLYPFSTEYDDADFEDFRLGMWQNSNTDNLNWDFNRFFTQTVDTGPFKDHTSGLGT